ncbi:MAG TPA: NAD(P)/FAD-dependent oxidoreductase [Thermoleophilaceae bacterium]
MTLFTSRRYDSLPGLPFPGDPDGYPSRDEVVSYLQQYAERFDLPVELGSNVRSVSRGAEGFAVELDGARIEADQVVIATGPFQTPRIPAFANGLDSGVVQMHSDHYRKPAGLPEGTVLVVGGGNTGFQIAEELSDSREVHLAVGSRQTPLPQRIFGRDLFWYLEVTGLMRKSAATRIGRRLAGRDTLIGSSPRTVTRRSRVELRPRAVGAEGSRVTFSDGSAVDVHAVIWATGYTTDYSWVGAPVFDGAGRVLHQRGVTASPGLYFLGMSWQHTRGSALLGWVKDDAEYIAQHTTRTTPSFELRRAA